jgi:DNA-binding HxlR family transcriptional regulator
METASMLPEGPAFERYCPTRVVLGRIADKWTVLIMNVLSSGAPRRFNELRRSIEGISQKMLTQTLRDLERDGLIARTVYPEVPPRVEYRLTALGQTLREPVRELARWAHEHFDEIQRAQAAFDARAPGQRYSPS